MAEKKIPCGGWYIDDKTMVFEKKILSVKTNPGVGPMAGNLDMDGRHIVNATSISGLPETHQVTIEDELNMNNHRITGVANPQAPQDAVTMSYLGEVFKTGDAVADCAGSSVEEVKNTVNALLVSLRKAGYIQA